MLMKNDFEWKEKKEDMRESLLRVILNSGKYAPKPQNRQEMFLLYIQDH